MLPFVVKERLPIDQQSSNGAHHRPHTWRKPKRLFISRRLLNRRIMIYGRIKWSYRFPNQLTQRDISPFAWSALAVCGVSH